MPRFKLLDYLAQEIGTTALQPGRAAEVGTSGLREAVLRALVEVFADAWEKAVAYQKASQRPQVRTEARMNVKELAAWHTAQQRQNKAAEQARLNADVMRLRTWLTRQGVWFTGADKVNWPKTMELKICYDSEARQKATEVLMLSGRLHFSPASRQRGLFDTEKMLSSRHGPGHAIYVMSETGRLYVSSASVGHRHHSSLLAGAPVGCAGEIQVTRGKITLLSDDSGHYAPTTHYFLQVLAVLQKNNFDLDFPVSVFWNEAPYSYPDVLDFMVRNTLDDVSFEELLKASEEWRVSMNRRSLQAAVREKIDDGAPMLG